jgi:hypothetical protein
MNEEQNLSVSDSSRGAENYVAWCRYTTESIVTCDSDAQGAFKVYRWPASRIRDLEGQIKQLNLLYMQALAGCEESKHE